MNNLLNFRTHVAPMNQKGGRGVNALSRVSKCLDTVSKMSILQSFVLGYYNFCPVLWHFIGTEDAKKTERVQYRALNFANNDLKASYGMLRERSGLSLLYTRRIRLLLIEIYKMYNCACPRYLHNEIGII